MIHAKVLFPLGTSISIPKDTAVNMLTCIQPYGPLAGHLQHNIPSRPLKPACFEAFPGFLLTPPFGIWAALFGVGTKKIDWREISQDPTHKQLDRFD